MIKEKKDAAGFGQSGRLASDFDGFGGLDAIKEVQYCQSLRGQSPLAKTAISPFLPRVAASNSQHYDAKKKAEQDYAGI